MGTYGGVVVIVGLAGDGSHGNAKSIDGLHRLPGLSKRERVRRGWCIEFSGKAGERRSLEPEMLCFVEGGGKATRKVVPDDCKRTPGAISFCAMAATTACPSGPL